MERAKNTALVLAETPSPRLLLPVQQQDRFIPRARTAHYEVVNNEWVLKSESFTYDRVPADGPALFLKVR